MKKAFSFILCLVILIFSVVGVSATKTDPEDTYYIEELGITIYVPLFTAATRNVNNLDISQEEYEEMVKNFEEENIYYYGYCTFYSYLGYLTELIIYGNESDTRSLSDKSDIILENHIYQQKQELEDLGVEVIKSEIYESFDAKYILFHFADSEGNYGINYYTIENYKVIDIVMWSYGGEPPASAKKDLLSVINTIKFDEPTGMQIYEKNFTLSIAENGKLTPLGESLILTGVIVLVQIIAGVVVLIILLNKRKKRRKAAQMMLNAQAEAEKKFCIYCGTQLKVSDTFCHRCGKSQANTENSDIAKP